MFFFACRTHGLKYYNFFFKYFQLLFNYRYILLEAGSGPIIAIVIIILVIIVVIAVAIVARSQGLLCFSGKTMTCLHALIHSRHFVVHKRLELFIKKNKNFFRLKVLLITKKYIFFARHFI